VVTRAVIVLQVLSLTPRESEFFMFVFSVVGDGELTDACGVFLNLENFGDFLGLCEKIFLI
jgi:hypothetical protein